MQTKDSRATPLPWPSPALWCTAPAPTVGQIPRTRRIRYAQISRRYEPARGYGEHNEVDTVKHCADAV